MFKFQYISDFGKKWKIKDLIDHLSKPSLNEYGFGDEVILLTNFSLFNAMQIFVEQINFPRYSKIASILDKKAQRKKTVRIEFYFKINHRGAFK